MKIAVVIASHMRPVALAATLSSLSGQIRPPDETIVSVVGPDDLPQPMPTGVKAVYSERGASKQRNQGTQALSTNIDIVVFLDDDMILHRDYLRGMESIFSATPDAALIMGHLITNGGVSIEKAFELADCPADSTHYDVKRTTFGDVYGCNMCVRFDVAVAEPFDERLPLYSYMEDMDFGTRVRGHGHIGYYYGSLAVHLRTSEGRVSHRALGFSEVMNPAYLAAKGTLPRFHALSSFIVRKPLTNLARLITGPERVQRRERFIGNCIALRHLLVGRLDPGQVCKIEAYTVLNLNQTGAAVTSKKID